jgi:7-cyano-7-deazaguanine synthase in queuosine biosynthesis
MFRIKASHLPFLILFLFALIFSFYKLDNFYQLNYDQERDYQVVQKILSGDLTLIGPQPEADRLQRLGHPHRNVVLQALAVQYGHKLRATGEPNLSTVLTSTVGDDSFPHSSLLALRTMTLLTCEDTGDWNWQVTSPLVDTQFEGRPIYKKDLITYALENGIPLDKTRTCIEGGEPDGTCAECVCRLRAFEQAGTVDPIKYK